MTDIPTAASTDVVTFVDPSKLMKAVPLQFPVAFRGVTYTEIYLKRLTSRQIAVAFEDRDARRATDPDASLNLPLYVNAQGQSLPPELIEGLEADDSDTLDEEALQFLPRRFRGLVNPVVKETNSQSIQASGSSGEPTS